MMKKNLKVLDVGCYDEIELIELKKRFSGSEVWGIDIDVSRINSSKKANTTFGIHFKYGFAEKIPFGKESFDVVFCSEVLEHVNDLEKSLLEIQRVTKKRGVVILTFPDSKSEEELNRISSLYSSQIGHRRIISPSKVIKNFLTKKFKLKKFQKFNAIEHIFWKYLLKNGYQILDQNAKLSASPPIFLRVLFAMLNQEETKNKNKAVVFFNIIFRPLSKIIDIIGTTKRVRLVFIKDD
jgi:ubiquinone/menaquinone biosynthesis C-methylase UbiE